MTITANYESIKNLSMLDDSDLVNDDSIICLQKALEFAALDKTKVPTIDQLITHLRNQSFYIPTLAAYDGSLGFFLSTGFLETNCNFVLGDQIASQSKEKDEPKRFSISFGTSEYTVETSIKFLPIAKIKEVGLVEDLVDAAGAVNQTNLDLIISLLKPAPLSSLPEGTYTVLKVVKTDASTLLTLEGDLEVRVNKATPDSIKEITSKDGSIYASSNGVLKRGINLTGLANRIIPVGEEDSYLGKTYKVVATATCNGGNSDYYAAKLGEIDGELVSDPKWCIVDGGTNQLTLNNLSKGKATVIKIASVKKPTGNMTYPRPEFTPVKSA